MQKRYSVGLTTLILALSLLMVTSISALGEVEVLRGASVMSEASAIKPNDITVRNDVIEFTVGVETGGSYGMPPGVIVDAGNEETGDMVATLGFVADGFNEWVKYTDIEVTTNTEEKAVVTSSGHWQGNEDVRIVTTYTLEAGNNFIEFSTDVENVGDKSFEMTSGYAVSTSGMQTYLPGYGDVTEGIYSMPSVDTLPLNWVGGYNENKGTYGFYFPDMTHFTASDTWVDPFWKIDLEPGDSVNESAKFFIWEETDVSKPLNKFYELNDIPTGTIGGTVKTTSGEPVPNPYVNIKQDGENIVTVRGDEKGKFQLNLAGGDYTVDAGLEGYSQNEPKSFTVETEETKEVTYEAVEDPGTVILETMTEELGRVPFQVKINSDGKYRESLYTGFNGRKTLTMPPGEYTFELVYGDGITTYPVEKNITVKSGGKQLIQETVSKAFKPNGNNYYSSDLHHHSNILDGTTPPKDLVKSFLASDLDLTFVSDHNSVGSHQVLDMISEKVDVPFVPGMEITTEKWGHFNAYSLDMGMASMGKGNPESLFDDARDKGAEFIHVNHPNTGGSYFDRTVRMKDGSLEFTEGFVGSFDGIEINGAWGDDDEKTLKQTYSFWNMGKKYTTLAASDTHGVWQAWGGSGAERTFVYVGGELTPDKFLEALDEQHAFWTYGPLVYLEANGEIPGETVTKPMVELTATVKSTEGLKKAVLLKNGEPVKNYELSGNTDFVSYTEKVDGDGWYALKVVESDGDMAHTNPIWYR